MRIFLAGGTGAIGRLLIPMLLNAGHEVTASSRTAAGVDAIKAAGAEATRLDAFDRDGVAQAVARSAPELIVHQLTALSVGDPAANARIRREGTRNLVDAAHAAGVGRIIAQSIAWAYKPGDRPAGEGTPLDVSAAPPRANTIGGIQALEAAVAELDHSVVLRYGTLYGPDTWYRRGGLVAESLAAGTMPATDAVSSFLHVQDAAHAVIEALAWPSGPVNIVDDEPAPGRTWIPALCEALGLAAPEPSPGRAGWERGADNTYARDTLGWQPLHPSWRTGFTHL
jgi:nucleoside-diphosphate-sugar epimerase